MTTKISVSLTENDIAALDRFIEGQHLPSRSAAIRLAIARLDAPRLSGEYAEAFAEWSRSSNQDAWDSVSSDGISDETW